MWIIQKNAVPDEQQDSNQQLENRFRSGGMVLNNSLIRIYKQIEEILSIIIKGSGRC